MKLIVALLLVCLGLGFVYHHPKSSNDQLHQSYHHIDRAAKTLDLPALTKLSEASKSNFQRAYIEYRLASAAEAATQYSNMEAAFSRALELLDVLQQSSANAEVYALTAAIHLKRLQHSDEPEIHRAALDRALSAGQKIEPENPAILLIAAEAMDQIAGISASQTAMAELLRHEAGIQLDRRCSSLCPSKESAYVWQGLLDSLQSKNRPPESLLLAKASCASVFAASGS